MVGWSRLHLRGRPKYKNLTGHHVPNSDLYQMLSNATALDLPGGLLVYA